MLTINNPELRAVNPSTDRLATMLWLTALCAHVEREEVTLDGEVGEMLEAWVRKRVRATSQT